MRNKDEAANEQNIEVKKHLNDMTAYGSDWLGIIPVPKDTIGNEDTEADKKHSRE